MNNVSKEAMLSNVSISHSGTAHATSLTHPNVEISFLVITIVLGTIGNLLVIAAALLEKSLRKMRLIFVINLAVADLIITAWFLPQILANVVNGYINSLAHIWGLCFVTGFLLSWCCEVSMLSLMFIAVTRYLKVTRPNSCKKWFGQRQSVIICILIWIECFLVALPLVVGWNGSGSMIWFDVAIVSCAWNDRVEIRYNIFIAIVTIIIPLLVTIICYVQTFRHIIKSRTRRKEVINSSNNHQFPQQRKDKSSNLVEMSEIPSNTEDSIIVKSVQPPFARQSSIKSHKIAQCKRTEERERNLLMSLVVVVIFFVLCWTPCAIVVLLPDKPSNLAKRASTWLALSNSAINCIIYGLLNRQFRQGYVTIMKRISSILCCCSWNPLARLSSKFSLSQTEVKTVQFATQEYKQQNIKFS